MTGGFPHSFRRSVRKNERGKLPHTLFPSRLTPLTSCLRHSMPPPPIPILVFWVRPCKILIIVRKSSDLRMIYMYKIWKIVAPDKRFYSLFWFKFSGFKLNFESQFDILYTIFCFNIRSEKKGNDHELTKYLINDCGFFWIMRACVLQTALSLAQSVPHAHFLRHLHICFEG